MTFNRRRFLKLGGAALAAPAVAPTVAFAATPDNDTDLVVVIYQRGGADGLYMIPPYGDSNYYNLRPTLGVPAPGGNSNTFDLDGFFGMHSTMGGLKSIYDEGDLAVIHASGSPSSSRSHFDAQDFMEQGVAMKTNIADGWISRHLDSTPNATPTTFRALALGSNAPLAMRGDVPAVAIQGFDTFDLTTQDAEAAAVQVAFRKLYAGNTFIDLQSQQAFDAVDELKAADPGQYTPANGAVYPDSPFGQKMQMLAQLVRSNIGLEIAHIDIPGWDHHDGLAGLISPMLQDMSLGLLAFYTDMGNLMDRITIVTMSEFGRRAYENGSGGTDHGHGNVMMAIGKNVNGGQVITDWPGLAQSDLFEGDDLEVSIDYRTVLGELVNKRLGNPNTDDVFPNFNGPDDAGIFI